MLASHTKFAGLCPDALLVRSRSHDITLTLTQYNAHRYAHITAHTQLPSCEALEQSWKGLEQSLYV